MAYCWCGPSTTATAAAAIDLENDPVRMMKF